MIQVFYSAFSTYPDEMIIEQKLRQLPAHIQGRILRYKDTRDRFSRLTGILLLNECIKMYGLEKTHPLDSIVINNNGKPSFPQNLFFSIAYAENLCILAVNFQEEIGIDLEKIRSLDTGVYSDYFTEREWQFIHSANNPYAAFFDYWTRKEAVLKFVGLGLTMNMNEFEVIEDVISIQNRSVYLKKVDLLTGYSCHIASASENEIALKEMDLA